MKEMLRKGIVWIVKHPWVALFAVVSFVIILTFLPSGSDEDKKEVNTSTEKIEPAEDASPGKDSQSFESLPQAKKENKKADVPADVSQDGEAKRDKSSPFDDNAQRRQEAFRDIAADPAVQYLPYRGALITADIADRVNGKLVVHVKYMSDRSFAVREWREFLSSHDDDGRSYQVVYIEKK
jgi:hypothetical protein